jgi:penicillin-binding protein 1C
MPVKRTGFTSLPELGFDRRTGRVSPQKIFYFLGRPVFWLILVLGYSALVTLALLRRITLSPLAILLKSLKEIVSFPKALGHQLLTLFHLLGKTIVQLTNRGLSLILFLTHLSLQQIFFLAKQVKSGKRKILSLKLTLFKPPKLSFLYFFFKKTPFRLHLKKLKFSLKPKISFRIKIPRVTIIFPKLKLVRVRFLVPLKLVAFSLGIIPSLILITSFYTVIIKELPSPDNLARPLPLTTKIYDRNGKLLFKIYRDQNRTKVQLSEIPLIVRQATIAIEDKDFYQHRGVSLTGIGRAVYLLVFKGRVTGGSTITQQLVKNTLLTSEKTLIRKLKELVLASLVEQKYTKDQILEMYLNESGYGGAAYGIEEASQKYFGKKARDLNLAEAALLTGLPASPTRYSPLGAHPELAKERQAEVLRRMAEDGYITESQLKEALGQYPKFFPGKQEILAPHFVMYVKEVLARKYGERMVEEGGFEVTTSLDLEIQEIAQKIVKEEVDKLQPLRISNGAALVTNPKTGEILAMVGSKDYFATDIDGNYNVTTASRQPGSSIKPVTYSIALERGFTLASIIPDNPITYKVPGQPPYSPTNYDHRFHGNVPLKVALGSSYNVPAVKILSAFGVGEMIKRGRSLGITSWSDPSNYGLSLTLGGGEVKMADMAVVYGTFANLGKKVNLKPILRIKDGSGKILEEEGCLPDYLGNWLAHRQANAAEDFCASQVLDKGVAYLITNILSDNSARTPAFGAHSLLLIPGHEVAVKTGTTQNLRDNWTIGYTPSFLVATWVGNNNNQPMSYVASGVTGASPIWNKIMGELLKNKPNEPFEKPDNITTVQICSLTGTLPCEGCPNVHTDFFLAGTQPKVHCDPEKIKQTLEEKAKEEEEKRKQEGQIL